MFKSITRVRLFIPLLVLALAALACNLGADVNPPTATPASGPTSVALSDVPEVEIRSPENGTEVVIRTEVQVYVRAVDKTGVTRIEMRVNNLIVDTVASPEANGTPTLDSILSWTPSSTGQQIIEVVAFRGNTRGNPKQITLTVRDSAAQVTRPAMSAQLLTASPTVDPTCRVRTNTDRLNVRSGPGINYDILTNVQLGSQLPVYGMSADRSWYQVNANGLIGWVSGAFVTVQGICSNLIVVQSPPSPTPPAGATAFVFPPTFTPLPTLPPPPTMTIVPVVVLPRKRSTPLKAYLLRIHRCFSG